MKRLKRFLVTVILSLMLFGSYKLDGVQASPATNTEVQVDDMSLFERVAIGGGVGIGSVGVLFFIHNANNRKTEASVYADKSKTKFEKTGEQHVRTYKETKRGVYK